MKIAIELPYRFALRALRELGNEVDGQFITKGCRCTGCIIQRKVRAQIQRAVDKHN